MNSTLRLTALVGLSLATLGVMWVVGRQPTAQQSLSLRPVLDRAVEAKAALDRLGQGAFQASDEEELALGDQLCQGFSLSLHDSEGQAWLQGVLQRLEGLGALRREHRIRYRLQVVDYPAINAFALPGGHLFVTTGMLAVLESEAEAAAVIAHEMAHVDLRHCIERYQYELKAQRVGGSPVAAMASLGSRVMLQGFQDEQEGEADRWGMQIAARAGYPPQAGQKLFHRMLEMQPADLVPRTLPGEVAHSALDALEDIFASHPRLEARIENLERAQGETGLDPERRRYYLGGRNRRELRGRNEVEFPEEWVSRRIYP